MHALSASGRPSTGFGAKPERTARPLHRSLPDATRMPSRHSSSDSRNRWVSSTKAPALRSHSEPPPQLDQSAKSGQGSNQKTKSKPLWGHSYKSAAREDTGTGRVPPHKRSPEQKGGSDPQRGYLEKVDTLAQAGREKREAIAAKSNQKAAWGVSYKSPEREFSTPTRATSQPLSRVSSVSAADRNGWDTGSTSKSRSGKQPPATPDPGLNNSVSQRKGKSQFSGPVWGYAFKPGPPRQLKAVKRDGADPEAAAGKPGRNKPVLSDALARLAAPRHVVDRSTLKRPSLPSWRVSPVKPLRNDAPVLLNSSAGPDQPARPHRVRRSLFDPIHPVAKRGVPQKPPRPSWR